MIKLTMFFVGVFIGLLICYIILRNVVKRERNVIQQEFATDFEKWKVEFEDKIRSDSLERSRAGLKGRVGEQFAPLLPMFKYHPSDARFIGNPIDYIIFDGYTDVKDGESDDITEIIFVDVKTGKSKGLTKVENRIKKAVEEKKVRWDTIHLNVD